MATYPENKKIAKVMSEALLSQITKLDQGTRRIKLSHERGFDWVPIDDIITLEIWVEIIL